MIELKPCPFCGGKAPILKEIQGHQRVAYMVTCGNRVCGVSTGIRYCGADAIAMWNTRQPSNEWQPIETLEILPRTGERFLLYGENYNDCFAEYDLERDAFVFFYNYMWFKLEPIKDRFTHYALLTPPEVTENAN